MFIGAIGGQTFFVFRRQFGTPKEKNLRRQAVWEE